MSDVDKALEHARAIVAQGADGAGDGPHALASALLALHREHAAMAAVVEAAEAYVASMQTTKALSLDGLAYRELHVAKNRAALIAAVADTLRAAKGER